MGPHPPSAGMPPPPPPTTRASSRPDLAITMPPAPGTPAGDAIESPKQSPTSGDELLSPSDDDDDDEWRDGTATSVAGNATAVRHRTAAPGPRAPGRPPPAADRRRRASGKQGRARRYWRQVLELEDGDLRARLTLHSVSLVAHAVYLFAVVVTGGLVGLWARWFPDQWIRVFGRSVAAVDDSMLLGASSTSSSAARRATGAESTTPLVAPSATVWVHLHNSWTETHLFPLQHEFFNGHASNVFAGAATAAAADHVLYQLVYFDYRCVRYLWSPAAKSFTTTSDWKDQRWTGAAAAMGSTSPPLGGPAQFGLTQAMAAERRQVFGSNSIEIPARSTLELVMNEILHPFYIFQVFSIILWCLDDYYYYASCIFILSVLSTLETLVETKRNIKRLREMSRFTCLVNVLRGGQWRKMTNLDLVPGDLFEVSMADFTQFPCDALLLSGDCIVNESMLTGESIPVSKVSADDVRMLDAVNLHDPQVPANVSKSFLFCGTRVIRVRSAAAATAAPGAVAESALAMAVRTGFNTTKGSLIRSMLFPKPHKFKFYRDSFRFIGVLACFAAIGFCFSLYNFIQHKASVRVILLRALDLITIIIPPALPATMSIGTSFAISRLRKANIFCISPNHVNVGGKVNAICFDKTGTLTEDGLDVLGVHTLVADNGTTRFSPLLMTPADVAKTPSDAGAGLAMHAMATCHGIKVLDAQHVGDPLDLKMFAWTGWLLEETVLSTNVKSRDGLEDIGIIKQFEFVSELRRMSVVTKKLDDGFRLFCKGAPESVREICDPASLPINFDQRLTDLAHNGFRMIALACRDLSGLNLIKVDKMPRMQAESGLTFLAFVVFENKLKPGSKVALDILRTAQIRCMMCTGDNVLTAISVSRECGIVDRTDDIYVPRLVHARDDPSPSSASSSETEAGALVVPGARTHVVWEAFDDPRYTLDPMTLTPCGVAVAGAEHRRRTAPYALAVTGHVFDWVLEHAPQETIWRMLYKGQVYARMSPDQKQWLVEKLQEMGYCVSFTGDGANDCAALKQADVGLSLSEAEASVAAPFTSTSHDITCILDVIKEGRAALVTSFSCFKYMALYSFIQFTSVTTLYTVASNLGDFQFLYVDLAIILPLAVTMGRSSAYHALVPKRPTANLLSKKVLTSLIGNILLQLAFQLFMFQHVTQQPWYTKPIVNPDEKELICFENSALFFLSSFQYIVVAVCFTVGPPYRSSMLKNYAFIASVLVLMFVNIGLLATRDPGTMDLFELLPLPFDFQLRILLIASLHFAVAWVAEKYLYVPLSAVGNRAIRRLLRWTGRARGVLRHEPVKPFKQVAAMFAADEAAAATVSAGNRAWGGS
ncbi:HAD ATPase, P-type, family IC [Allomyces macrogynus ATCC 38327]|uniref:HAD ATPase, P-type, family IC n=1 Tax=Allomyces macrogynus (strain ATCC 38327) TaxID=578462 RepID=A0A0L0S8T9_ALLM3|nr:HAD ATPase, P-type, family IC [Allomyces macrogynus ATCC 38327]|eukprot:KNE58820.1 HAD ATPase, P-type, family IC [Allomyces macrogynus ATCC 38327]